jgi:hypothetical protein
MAGKSSRAYSTAIFASIINLLRQGTAASIVYRIYRMFAQPKRVPHSHR